MACKGLLAAILVLALLAALSLYVPWAASTGGRDHAARLPLVLVFAVAHLGTVAMHATTLMDYDRYASMFDFVLVLVGMLILDDMIAARRATSSARTSPSARVPPSSQPPTPTTPSAPEDVATA